MNIEWDPPVMKPDTLVRSGRRGTPSAGGHADAPRPDSQPRGRFKTLIHKRPPRDRCRVRRERQSAGVKARVLGRFVFS